LVFCNYRQLLSRNIVDVLRRAPPPPYTITHAREILVILTTLLYSPRPPFLVPLTPDSGKYFALLANYFPFVPIESSSVVVIS
jgi:hypothetical protein